MVAAICDFSKNTQLLPTKTHQFSKLSYLQQDGFIQSHHPIQDAWAQKWIEGYKRNDAPAVLLQSSSGAPHAAISAAQRSRRAKPGGWNTTLLDEFNKGFEEMIKAGIPVGQAKKAFKDAYSYFDTLREANKNNPNFDI